MDWKARFRQLPPARRLAVAAAAVERVLPLYSVDRPEPVDAGALRDAVSLLWLIVEGRQASKVEISAVINEVTALPHESDPGRAVCRAAACALEAASHNPDAGTSAIDAAAEAVSSYAGAAGAAEERDWHEWAVDRAGQAELSRATFSDPDAPRSSWRSLDPDALPLFGGRD